MSTKRTKNDERFQFKTAAQLLADMPKVPQMLIDPFIPKEGLVMVHGKWGAAKTPLALEMALAISTGENFLGFKTQQARVLFLEFDMPEGLFIRRFITAREEAQNVNLGFVAQKAYLDSTKWFTPQSKSEHRFRVLEQISKTFNPEVVFIDALTRVFQGDMLRGESAPVVYDAWERLFPNAALVFLAHDRKSRVDGNGKLVTSDEDFSGNQNWANPMQSMIHLVKQSSERKSKFIWTKAQYDDHERIKPFVLQVADDGSGVADLNEERNAVILEILSANPDAKARELDEMIAEKLGLKERAARTCRLQAENWAMGAKPAAQKYLQ